MSDTTKETRSALKTLSPRTTRDIVREMKECRDERRSISARDKELIAIWRKLEMEMLGRFDEEGMTKASTEEGTISITKTKLPNVEDWDILYEHIKKTGDFYLLQKRPAAAAFRELQDAGIDVPGITQYEKREISLHKANK